MNIFFFFYTFETLENIRLGVGTRLVQTRVRCAHSRSKRLHVNRYRCV